MYRYTLGIVLALLACGCQKNDDRSTTSAVQKQVQKRPVVAIVPFFDRTTQTNISWDLSEELTNTLRFRLSQKDKLYLASEGKVQAQTKKLTNSNDPFGTNLQWIKKTFFGNEFVVFIELIEHTEVPLPAMRPVNNSTKTSPEITPADLKMSARLRIVDLRFETPQIVLQEIIHDNHHIPKQFNKTSYQQIEWGKENYQISPLGMAHTKFVKEIAMRIEDYVLLAASR